jgi:hypothetical protein
MIFEPEEGTMRFALSLLFAENVYLLDEQSRFWLLWGFIVPLSLGIVGYLFGPLIPVLVDHLWRARVVAKADLIPAEKRCSKCEGTGFYCPHCGMSARFACWKRWWTRCCTCSGSGKREETGKSSQS